MEEKKIIELNGFLKAMDLPFRSELIEALIREDLAAGRGENADDITMRLYGLSGIVPPGEDAPLLFEQLVFELFREIKAGFDPQRDGRTGALRESLLTLMDRWMQLSDFLQEEEQDSLDGKAEIQGKLDELLKFVHSLLSRVNHPDDESDDSVEELSFLCSRSEETLVGIMEQLDHLLHPPAAPSQEGPEGRILTLKVSLAGLPRPVWRRIRVSGQLNLAQFHRVLQKAMGWWELYPYQFEQAGRKWSAAADEEHKVEDSESCLLQALLEEEDDLLHYHYDLPEGWHHKILVEDTGVSTEEGFLLECLAGEGACPPEDCGGAEGYAGLLFSLRPDAGDAEKEDYAWASDFVPGAFSLEDTNKALRELL